MSIELVKSVILWVVDVWQKISMHILVSTSIVSAGALYASLDPAAPLHGVLAPYATAPLVVVGLCTIVLIAKTTLGIEGVIKSRNAASSRAAAARAMGERVRSLQGPQREIVASLVRGGFAAEVHWRQSQHLANQLVADGILVEDLTYDDGRNGTSYYISDAAKAAIKADATLIS